MTDAHVHIERGTYSLEWINEFITYALKRGLSEIFFLEHSHRFFEFKAIYRKVASYNEYQRSWLDRKTELSLDTYKELITEVRKHRFPVTLKFGLEVCYIEGTEQSVKSILKDFDWDFVTGSIHWIDNWGFDHKEEFWKGKDIDKTYLRYYELMKSLIKSGLFNNLAHPDSIKCFGHLPNVDLTETYEEIACLLNQYDMYAEQSGGLYLNYGFPELGMNQKMLSIFKNKNVKLLTASDAHRPEDTGKFIKEMVR
ncbi:MAG: histidinol phosphate phosphatase HisJ family [Eubacterium sp.]|jgi:histidinol-phosphatase (PHP family)|nr:histidinol phosphate phosphatase HisJ family [Eubacterium sp.]